MERATTLNIAIIMERAITLSTTIIRKLLWREPLAMHNNDSYVVSNHVS